MLPQATLKLFCTLTGELVIGVIRFTTLFWQSDGVSGTPAG